MRGLWLCAAAAALAPQEEPAAIEPTRISMQQVDTDLTRWRAEYEYSAALAAAQIRKQQAMDPPSPPPFKVRADWWGLGVLYTLLSTLVGTIGKDLFRLASISTRHQFKILTLGVLLAVVVDPALNVLALSTATQAIVSACAGFVIVWNLALAPFVLDESLTVIRLASGVCILAGTIGVGLFGPHSEVVRTELDYLALFHETGALIYFAFLAAFCAVATWRWQRAPHTDGRSWGPILAGAIAGNNFFLKAALSIFWCELDDSNISAGCRTGPTSGFHSWELYAIALLAVLTAAGGLGVLAVALRHSEALDAVTIFTGTQIVAAALSANIVLHENTVSDGWMDSGCTRRAHTPPPRTRTLHARTRSAHARRIHKAPRMRPCHLLALSLCLPPACVRDHRHHLGWRHRHRADYPRN